MSAPCLVGIDVGGTFIDYVLSDPNTGALVHYKEPTEVAARVDAVMRRLSGLLERAGRPSANIGLIAQGTTLALNAVIERKGARVALVISEGFGDTMVLGRGGLPNTYDYKAPKPVPLIPRDLVFEVSVRLRPDGTVTLSPSDDELTELAERLRQSEVEAVAVVVLNAYAHPELEARIATALAARLPAVLISPSASVWPEVREYERTLITVLNGYIHPLMNAYYG